MHKGIKILHVDDEELFLVTTRKIMSKKGFSVIPAAGGREALEMLSQDPDVVILDIKMPGMDGHEVLCEIKKRKPNIPVIMLTGHGGISSAEKAREQGAFDYLEKPCDMDLLSSKIMEAYNFSHIDRPEEEKLVRDVMVPIDEYTTINEDQTVGEAVRKLWESFTPQAPANGQLPPRHASIIVFGGNRVIGILAFPDLLKAIMPPYLSIPRPFPADSIQYSPMFWRGAFNREVRLLAKREVNEIMSPAPMIIDGDANLIEAAYSMVTNKTRRLVVMQGCEVLGVIREDDLFFEIEKVLRKT